MDIIFNDSVKSNTSFGYNISSNFSAFNFDNSGGFHTLRIKLNLILLPIIILIGITGNSLAFFVLNKAPFKHQSSSVYLAYLSFIDAGFLVCLIFMWFDFILENPITITNVFCQVLPFLTYVFGFLSVYTVVAFTVERFIVTYFPLRRYILCTRKRAKITLIVLTFCALVFYSFPLYMSAVFEHNGRQFCILKSQFIFAGHLLAYADTVLTLVLPAVIILVLNGAIGVRLVHIFSAQSDNNLGRQRLHSSTSVKGHYNNLSLSTKQTPLINRSAPESNDAPVPSVSSRQAAAYTTRTLVILSTLFVLLNLPSHALRIYSLMISLTGSRMSVNLYIAQELLQFVYYVNFASNFFLYSLCSKTFRETARKTLLLSLNCGMANTEGSTTLDLELNMRRKSMSQRTEQSLIISNGRNNV